MINNDESPDAVRNKARLAQLDALLEFPDSDAGNAEAFELLHGDRFRFDHDRGKWLAWNGRYWSEDKTGEAKRAAIHTIRSRQEAALRISDRTVRRERIENALKCESAPRLSAMLQCAQSIKSLAVRTEDFDRLPYLLVVSNGVLDLRTGWLRKPRPEDLISRSSAVVFRRNAAARRWRRFVREIFRGDDELIAYVQRAVGYSLCADTREQCFFILFGSGANGKSTFVEIVCKLLGTYAETAEFSTFLVRQNRGAPRNDLARLHGARFVKASEGEHRAPLDEALVKEMTGEDTIVARFLFREHFSFKPKFKIWLVTNYKPEIRGTDFAIWRRVRLIPFTQQFQGSKCDPHLREKLEAELSGILAWAVEGCLAWQREGLGEAPRVIQATREFRLESNAIGRFLNDCCSRNPEAAAPAGPLYEAYLGWCRDHAERAVANNLFARSLAERGITKTRTRKGVVYKGVGLSPVADVADTGPRRKGGR